ncbi:S9 family peptidase [Levilinea saccharolytica]|uniref:Peptidase S9 prolyl oligopeptidase catalytic domain-containing protein n=3 Tax=Levilinea saccharolytica TaxID=229921 RepID=A0A0P6XVW3_9CHLR|nr:prolyl oligopeptidase family serine peptidase [Levilinea saccharolytica]KPL80737.1 hypothetical protein ADN01_11470 [Levilinea saccharolytica]
MHIFSDYLSQVLALPSIRRALLSPDGRWVAFEWLRRHENQDVFVVAADGSQPPRPLTHTPEATLLASWSPDSRAVLVAEDRAGDERRSLYRVYLNKPQRLEPLTEPHPPYFLRGGALSADGRYLFYSANYDFEREEALDRAWVFRHDLHTGKREVLARPHRAMWIEPTPNAQGTHVLYPLRERHVAGRQFMLHDLRSGEVREVANFGEDVKTFARWMPDGRRILIQSEARPGDPRRYTRLAVWDLQTEELRWWVDDPQRNIESAWASPDGLVVINDVRQSVRCPSFLDLDSGEEQTLPRLEGNWLALGRAAHGAWVGVQYAAHLPDQLVQLCETPGQPPRAAPLSDPWERSALRSAELTRAEDFRFASSDGLEIQGWLLRAAPNRRRAILRVHGGPSMYMEDRLTAELQYYARCGFNVLAVNYRGSTGFGVDFRDRIKEDGWGGREQEDLACAARALMAAGLAEPGRVGVTGTSFGGYSAWHLATHYGPEVIGAAAPICGMTDLVVDYETTRPDLRPLTAEMMGGTPEQVPQRYAERSPIHFVERIRVPLLIVQGAHDPNVPPEHVRQVTGRLRACGVPFEVLEFADEGHGIYKPANLRILAERLAAFFDQALGEGSKNPLENNDPAGENG